MHGAIAAENGATVALRKLLKRRKIVNVSLVSKHNLPLEMLSHRHESIQLETYHNLLRKTEH